MKKLRKRILSVLCSLSIVGSLLLSHIPAFAAETNQENNSLSSYEITVGDTTVTLDEGEVASFPLELINPPIQTFASSDTVVNTAGILNVWGEGANFNWSIVMWIPATSFIGTVHTTDLSSGFSGGYTPVYTFSGFVPTSGLSGHLYRGSISGTAYFLGDPIAKTASNNISWIP